MTATPVLEMRHIINFGKFYAARASTTTVWPGEIRTPDGGERRRKSFTLMKILAGAYTATSGEI